MELFGILTVQALCVFWWISCCYTFVFSKWNWIKNWSIYVTNPFLQYLLSREDYYFILVDLNRLKFLNPTHKGSFRISNFKTLQVRRKFTKRFLLPDFLSLYPRLSLMVFMTTYSHISPLLKKSNVKPRELPWYGWRRRFMCVFGV